MFHTLNAPRAHQLQFRPLAHVVLMMFDDDDAFGYSGRVRAAERALCECVCVCVEWSRGSAGSSRTRHFRWRGSRADAVGTRQQPEPAKTNVLLAH